MTPAAASGVHRGAHGHLGAIVARDDRDVAVAAAGSPLHHVRERVEGGGAVIGQGGSVPVAGARRAVNPRTDIRGQARFATKHSAGRVLLTQQKGQIKPLIKKRFCHGAGALGHCLSGLDCAKVAQGMEAGLQECRLCSGIQGGIRLGQKQGVIERLNGR